MGQILHKRSRTTIKIRKEIQESKDSIFNLSKIYNINKDTVIKWRSRDFTNDMPMWNWRANSVLTKEEEYLIKEVRQKSWEPLDDLHLTALENYNLIFTKLNYKS